MSSRESDSTIAGEHPNLSRNTRPLNIAIASAVVASNAWSMSQVKPAKTLPWSFWRTVATAPEPFSKQKKRDRHRDIEFVGISSWFLPWYFMWYCTRRSSRIVPCNHLDSKGCSFPAGATCSLLKPPGIATKYTRLAQPLPPSNQVAQTQGNCCLAIVECPQVQQSPICQRQGIVGFFQANSLPPTWCFIIIKLSWSDEGPRDTRYFHLVLKACLATCIFGCAHVYIDNALHIHNHLDCLYYLLYPPNVCPLPNRKRREEREWRMREKCVCGGVRGWVDSVHACPDSLRTSPPVWRQLVGFKTSGSVHRHLVNNVGWLSASSMQITKFTSANVWENICVHLTRTVGYDWQWVKRTERKKRHEWET